MDDASFAATLTEWRQFLHARPTLTHEEGPTASFVAEKLRVLGVEVTERVGGNGVVGTINRGSHGAIGLRADMDALPLTEQNEALPYRSQVPGVMHACGHDGHTAALLGAAIRLTRDADWIGTVQLIFQPAEEGGGGAQAMIADGLLTRFPIDQIFSWHNWPGLAVGTIAVHDAAVMAAGSGFEIVFSGVSGHAAMPHHTRDAILALGHCIVALQSIVSRNVDPLDSVVVSVTKAQAGENWNQIARSATLRGTIRYLRPAAGALAESAIQRVAQGISASLGLAADVKTWRGVPPVENHPTSRDIAVSVANDVATLRQDLLPAMSGDDFAWFLQKVPGSYVWIGNGTVEDGRPLHDSRYDFNDTVLPLASEYLAGVAKRALAG